MRPASPSLSLPTWAPAGLLVLAVAAAYGQTLGFGRVWDDGPILAHLQRAWSDGGLAGLLSADYGANLDRPSGYWRPVTAASLLVNGLSSPPWLLHLGNLILYLASVLLVHRLALRLGSPEPGPLVAALAFALFPTHTESVAFITNRHDLLAGDFLLLSVLAWLAARRGSGGVKALAAGGAAFTLAVLSKESALMLPAVLLGWDLLERGGDPGGGGGGWWKRNRGWFLALGAGAALAGGLRLAAYPGGVGPGTTDPGALGAAGGGPGLLVRTVVAYLGALGFPWPVRLFYDPARIGLTPFTASGCLLLAALGWGAWRQGGKTLVLRSLAWAVGFLVPVLGFVPLRGAPVAARHLFLPSLATALLLGHLAGRARGSGARKAAGWGLALVLLLLGAGTVVQSTPWKDDLSVYRRLVEEGPGFAPWRGNLALSLLEAGKPGEALAESERALAIDPLFWQAWVVRGQALEGLGRPSPALASYRRARQIRPREPRISREIERLEGSLPGGGGDR